MEVEERDLAGDVYYFYGFQITSNYRFNDLRPDCTNQAAGMLPVKFAYHLDTHPPFSAQIEDDKLVFSSQLLNSEGKSQYTFYRYYDFDLIRVTGVADFYIRSTSIDCHLIDLAALEFTEGFFILNSR